MVHELLKQRFLHNGLEVADVNGESVKMPSSTRNCSTGEFMDYLAQIERWAQEFLNVTIPAPGEQTAIF